jgi:hypothetical protein
LEELGTDGRATLKQDARMRIGFIWLSIGPSDNKLWGSTKCWGFLDQLEEGLSCMEVGNGLWAVLCVDRILTDML